MATPFGIRALSPTPEKSPMIKTDTLVSSLPYDDQDKLKKGIEVKGDTSLRKCLEDFCS